MAGCSNPVRKSSSIPIDTKNRLVKRSRRASESDNAWWPYSESASTMPARNAPRAGENPARDAIHVMAAPTSTTATTNTSRLRDAATK